MNKVLDLLFFKARLIIPLLTFALIFQGATVNSSKKFPLYGETNNSINNIEDGKLIKKYADLLKLNNSAVEQNISLYRFIDSWMGTPYKWGGCNRGGIDCSCFIMTLFDQVFDIDIKRTTFTQFYDNDISLFRNSNSFGMGDLIFFKTNINRETKGNVITHVGMYLANGYFIQSSSSGVNIASLNATYWKKCFVAAGRLKDKYYKTSRLVKNNADIKDSKTMAVADQPNSDFDPVPYPEDLDELKGKYAGMMGIDSNQIVVPEMFEYIDKLRYAPFVLKKECGNKMGDSNCFIKGFFKDVLNLDVKTSNPEILSQKQTAKLKPANVPSAFDLILLKTNKRSRHYDVTGIYLYNNYFVHVVDDEIVISSLQDSSYKNGVASYYRLDQKLLKEGSNYIDSLRANPILKQAYLERVNAMQPQERIDQQKAEQNNSKANKKKKRNKRNKKDK